MAGRERDLARCAHRLGYLAAYRVPTDDQLDQTLYTLRSQASVKHGRAGNAGTAAHPTVAAACALTAERPGDAPVQGLTAQRGRHGSPDACPQRLA